MTERYYTEGATQGEDLKVLRAQFLLYAVVGGLSSCIDVGGFWLLSRLDLSLVPASAISFTAATIANYFMSYFMAFVRGRYSRSSEIIRLFAISLIGLGINTASVWGLVSFLSTPPFVAKVGGVPIALVWNFFGRRLFVFHKDLAPPLLSDRRKSLRS